MKNKIKTNFFSQSKKWPRRIPRIKEITLKTIKLMSNFFSNKSCYYINLVLSDKDILKKLNKRFKNKYKDTDVLTFVSNIDDKYIGKIFYCDIFFSIDTIHNYINKNKIDFYDHFNHLLIHSILHINGYDHKNLNQFKKMKSIEIKILKKLEIENPYK